MVFGRDSAHRFVPVAAGLLKSRARSSAERMMAAAVSHASRACVGLRGASSNHSSAVRTSILKPVLSCSNRPVGGSLIQWEPGFHRGVCT